MVMPADIYKIINKSIITNVDKKIIIDLYQPIVGNHAINLYLTLLNDLEKNQIVSKELSHYHLMSVMQLNLSEITIAKEKLEAVGLIDTYLKKDHINTYLYILYSPLSASEFLNHPILNIVLYNNIGKKEYDNVVSYYKVPDINLKDYEKMTHSFDQVFLSIPNNLMISNEDLTKINKKNISINKNFDFDLLKTNLDKSIINDKFLTDEVKDMIIKLSYIYNINELDMKNMIYNSINEKGLIDKDMLRKSCRNYYQFEEEGALPTLIYKNQPDHLKKGLDNTSKRSKMIYTFENVNPYYFIKSKYKDGKVTTRDLKIIENLLIDQKLYPGVVNVLIDYVLKINNQKLSTNYIETIAGHWKRLGIKTVEEAMNLCEKEHNKIKKMITTSKVKEEVKTPEWFDKNINKESITDDEKEELKALLNH